MPRRPFYDVNGYRLIFLPEHHKAFTKGGDWDGYVYEHMVVAEKTLGRELKDNEVVHHLNLNRSDNSKRNIIVLGRDQHAKLHMWINSGYPMFTNIKQEFRKSRPSFCIVCGKTLLTKDCTKFCSQECRQVGTRKVTRPNKKELKDEIKYMSYEAIGRKYGVSGTTIKKWAKYYGIKLKKRKGKR